MMGVKSFYDCKVITAGVDEPDRFSMLLSACIDGYQLSGLRVDVQYAPVAGHAASDFGSHEDGHLTALVIATRA